MTEGNGEVRELPKGWCWVQHKDIAEINPKLPSNDLTDDLIVSFLPMAAVEEKSGRYSLSEVREYGKVKKGYTSFINSDVIFAKITPCMENGKVAVVDNLNNSIGFGSTEFHVSMLTKFTNRKYLFYYLVQEVFRRDARQHMTGSAGQLRVPKPYFEEVWIPLAPLDEQQRIIERIEELVSDLDNGIESLKKAQKQLKVYRQAVLKWAFEGKLTEKWRSQIQQEKLDIKTGEELLAQIKAERENRYQQQLAEWEEAVREWEVIGKLSKKPTKPQKPRDLFPLTEAELSKLPHLPSNWYWVRIGDATQCLDSMRVPINKKERERRSGNISYYGANGQVGWIDNYLFDEPLVLVVEDETFVGREKPFSYKITGKSWINNHAHILRPEKVLDIDYLTYQLFYYPFTPLTTGTTGRKNLTQDALINAPMKLCSIEEQQQIAQEIEYRFSICDRLEATIIENLQKAEALRQSILKQAFEGKLVPQDPNDEPAEKLLERIKQEKIKVKKREQLSIQGI